MLLLDIWANFSGGVIEYAVSTYVRLGVWVYPLFFLGVIGYVYAVTRSATAGIAGIIVTFAVFAATNVFVDVPSYSLFLFLVTVIGFSLLVMALILKVVDRI